MRKYVYYCEVTKSRDDYGPGVYSVVTDGSNRLWYPTLNRLLTLSERVWQQGPRGGVRILKEKFWSVKHYGYGYITSNPEAMREFAWLKLRAKAVNGT